jgi:hypothetical protein
VNLSNRYGTIIAYYGSTKPNVLEAYVADVQERVNACIPSFAARPLAEVHATIIGLESYGPLAAEDEPAELAKLGGDSGLPALCGYLGCRVRLDSVNIQFGGFLDRDYAVSSRGKRLFERSLTVNGGQMMLLGWAVSARSEPTDYLDGLRRGAQQFGATHRYHQVPTDKDPDAYMVIGSIDNPSNFDNIEIDRVRHALTQSSCRTPLNVNSIQVATYSDTRLPRSSTRTWPLVKFIQGVSQVK